MTECKQQKMNASSTPKMIGEAVIQGGSVVAVIATTAEAHMLIKESDSDQRVAPASLRSLAACGSEVKYEVMYNQRDLKVL
jgi:carbamoylphosphate synthase large subunit